jgi:quercetin dioxygenase-like cupin family protein
MGSVAEDVMRKAACPVLVVKAPLAAQPDTRAGVLDPGLEMTAGPGDVIDVRPLGASLVSARTRHLVHTTAVDVLRLVVRPGQEITRRTDPGETLVHCLEGQVALTALGKTQVLEPGRLVHLPAGKPYSFQGIDDASLLLTSIAPRP